jgi:hypothetical protein
MLPLWVNRHADSSELTDVPDLRVFPSPSLGSCRLLLMYRFFGLFRLGNLRKTWRLCRMKMGQGRGVKKSKKERRT